MENAQHRNLSVLQGSQSMPSRRDQFPFTHFIPYPNLPGYPTRESGNIFSQLLLHTLPSRRCLLPQFPQDLNKALTPMPSQPGTELSPWQTCPLLSITTSLFQTHAAFIKSSRIILAPNLPATPDLGCPLPQRRQHLNLGAVGHLPKARTVVV